MGAAQFRDHLPQVGDRLFLTDGGIETTLIFHDGLELPDFAAVDLLRRAGGREALLTDFRSYAEINCAHPTHFAPALRQAAPWIERIRGIRANASTMRHADVNEAPALDEGDPEALAAQYAQLRAGLKTFTVMGGCCGTDARHVAAIARACVPLFGPELGTA